MNRGIPTRHIDMLGCESPLGSWALTMIIQWLYPTDYRVITHLVGLLTMVRSQGKGLSSRAHLGNSTTISPSHHPTNRCDWAASVLVVHHGVMSPVPLVVSQMHGQCMISPDYLQSTDNFSLQLQEINWPRDAIYWVVKLTDQINYLCILCC